MRFRESVKEKIKKQVYKPDSVSHKVRPLSFIWNIHCCIFLAAYPLTTRELHLTVSILDIAPHRVYLIALQHYLYILSVALVLSQILEMTAVNRYATLWCPDFPLPIYRER